MSEERFGPYELGRRIAVGGMAEIFLARRLGPGGFSKQLALKRVLPELARQERFRRMFADEARLCASLSHPGLVQVFDYGEVDGTPYLAMEWVDGCDLATLLESGEPLEPGVAGFVIAEVARALGHVHEARDQRGDLLGVVHRDLSPGNVLVGRQGEVKLGDFGVAKASGRLARTEAGRLQGTLRYLAPEQATGGAVGPATDLYAAGLLLFELLTGAPYVDGRDEVELLRAAAAPPRRRAAALRPELEAGWDRVLDRALALEPERRHPHAAALEEELRPLSAPAAEARAALSARIASASGCEPQRRRTRMISDGGGAARGRRRARLRRALPRLAAAAGLALVALAGGLATWRIAMAPAQRTIAGTGRGDEPRPPVLPRAPLSSAPASTTPGEPDASRAGTPAAAPGGEEAARAETTKAPAAVASRPPRAREQEAAAQPAPGSAPEAVAPPAEPAPDPRAALRRADRLRAALGLLPGDDEAADRLRAAAASLASGGAPAEELGGAVAAYEERLRAVVVDRAFIDRKLRRATDRVRRAGTTPELDRLSQQALREAVAGDLAGANRTLNRVFELAGRGLDRPGE